MARSKSTAVASANGSLSNNGSSAAHDASSSRRSLSPDSPSDRPLGPLSVTVPASEREEVKVNNASLVELKNACDDAIKKVCVVASFFDAPSASARDRGQMCGCLSYSENVDGQLRVQRDRGGQLDIPSGPGLASDRP